MTAEHTNGRPDVLERATIRGRRDAMHAELLIAMQAVERYRGALAILDELLLLADPGEVPA
jgi:hypothetical protein